MKAWEWTGAIVGLLLVVAAGVWYYYQPNEQTIGGDTDEHGCLIGAGFGWDEEVGACTRNWEVATNEDKALAKLAVAEIGSTDGLTVTSIEAADCEGCFYVLLSQGADDNQRRYRVTIVDGKVEKVGDITDDLAEVGNDNPAMVEITNLFAQKYNVDVSQIKLRFDQDTGTHIRGGVSIGHPGEVGGGGNFFAAMVDGKYELVYDGNGAFACSLLDDYGFPASMQEGCY
ncbi:MAG: hypothetical protein PHR51_02620 [Patescibacteria group bacterium]|nr:hypothetical protein [Patescibacteria group bacterium]